MCAIVHVVQRAGCNVVWHNDFLSWFPWSEDAGVTFGDKEAIRCQFRVSDQESYFVIEISGFRSWCFS